MMGAKRRQCFFFDTSCVPERTSLLRKKTQAKIVRCSGMSKFCPPAAASRESMRGNRNERTRCAADGGCVGGGRYSTKLAGERTSADIPCPNLVSCFWASFLKAREGCSKKKRRQTARPQFYRIPFGRGARSTTLGSIFNSKVLFLFVICTIPT
jgi:hypothetical protein